MKFYIGLKSLKEYVPEELVIMQLDMHYYGTYAMARAAGLNEQACCIIAYSAQYVDDNSANSFIDFGDGARIDSEATAHHPVDIKNVGSFDPQDQRRVWVPYHFLPGNEGESYTDKLKCTKNSVIAKEMLANHLGYSTSEYGLYLAGIAAHVYADTFSHYGFSGVSSRGNKVHQDSLQLGEDLEPGIKSYILDKAENFFKKAAAGSDQGLLPNIKAVFHELIEQGKATIAETGGALGHGSVATYPDRPYLSWRFNYENDENTDSGWRHNKETFLEGCRELHSFFSQIAAKHPELSSTDPHNFSDIEESVKAILAVQEAKDGRIEAWQAAAKSGIFGAAKGIPQYSVAEWDAEWRNLQQNPDNSNRAHTTNIYQFYRAAAYHRVFILRDLLPKYGLVVD